MREKEEREGERQKEKGGKGYANKVDKISTSFFFTNFPEDLGWGDLWKLFSKYGSVCDVFIPKKMDKWERKFGFVKFKETKDYEVEALCNKLVDVWWDTFKLRINNARFDKWEEKGGNEAGQTQSKRAPPGSVRAVSDDMSFKSLLVGEENSGGGRVDKDGMVVGSDGGRKKTRAISFNDVVSLELPVQEASVALLNQSMVGFF
jgi:RNA recognition motif-containing protein